MTKAIIGFGGDLHKRPIDISTLEGYTNAVAATEQNIINVIKQRGLTHFISLGDWYDKGYSQDVAGALSHYDMDNRINELVNGNFFGVIGNHIHLRLDSNPELHLIQPHPTLKTRHKISRAEPIIKTPKTFMIGTVQISLAHYSQVGDPLEYCTERHPSATYHIVCYHTHDVVPNSQLLKTPNNYHTTSSTTIKQILQGVDLAIVGDVHTPLGSFTIDKDDGTSTIMIVPGSLTNVVSKDMHTSINMPIIEISDTNEVSLSYQKINLNLNLISVKAKKVISDSSERIKRLSGKISKADKKETLEDLTDISEDADCAFLTYTAFLKKKGYDDHDKAMIKSVIADPTNIVSLISSWTKKKTEIEV